MAFPIQTLQVEVEQRWIAIYKFAKQMYDMPRPRSNSSSAKLKEISRPGISLINWISFSTKIRKDPGFHFFSFEPVVDNELGIVIANFNEFGKWSIELDNVNLEDPPIKAYQFVASKKAFVERKQSRVQTFTQWILELIIEFGSLNQIGSSLTSPTKFVRQLKEHCDVSDRIGNIFLTGGTDWFATIGCGSSPFGNTKSIILRYKENADLSRVPKVILEAVGKKPN